MIILRAMEREIYSMVETDKQERVSHLVENKVTQPTTEYLEYQTDSSMSRWFFCMERFLSWKP